MASGLGDFYGSPGTAPIAITGAGDAGVICSFRCCRPFSATRRGYRSGHWRLIGVQIGTGNIPASGASRLFAINAQATQTLSVGLSLAEAKQDTVRVGDASVLVRTLPDWRARGTYRWFVSGFIYQ